MIITLDDFNQQFTNHYDHFRVYCSTVFYNNFNIPNDGMKDSRVISKVHEVYEKIAERVEASAVTATTIVAYVKSIIRHAIYDDVRPDLIKNRLQYHSTDDWRNDGYRDIVEHIKQDEDNTQLESLEYGERSRYISKKIFQYLEKRYTDKEMFIFKSYYLMPKRMTYRRLEEQTGYSKSTCSNTIKKIKRDLRLNFEDWLENNK